MDRKEFENDLLNGDVTEKYLNMSREELEEKFGEEFLKTVNFGEQNNNSHQYELFEHILRTVDSVQTDGLSREDAIKVKVAAFFHDIGKPEVAQLNEKTGQTQYLGHAKQSAEMAKSILERLGYNEQEIEEVNFLIQSHDDFIPIAKKEDVTEERISKALTSIIKKTENYKPTISDFKKLIALCKGDAMAQNKIIERNGEIIDTQEDRISRLESIEEILPKAIILNQEKEIEKLGKQKNDIQNGPTPIEKNGKVVNQKQIDIWNNMSQQEKQEKIENIDIQIEGLRKEEEKLLEVKNDEKNNSTKKDISFKDLVAKIKCYANLKERLEHSMSYEREEIKKEIKETKEFIENHIGNNEEVLYKLYKRGYDFCVEFMGEELKTNKEFLLKLINDPKVKLEKDFLGKISKEMMKDKDINIAAEEKGLDTWYGILNNKELLLKEIEEERTTRWYIIYFNAIL